MSREYYIVIGRDPLLLFNRRVEPGDLAIFFNRDEADAYMAKKGGNIEKGICSANTPILYLVVPRAMPYGVGWMVFEDKEAAIAYLKVCGSSTTSLVYVVPPVLYPSDTCKVCSKTLGNRKFYCTACDADVYCSKVCRNKDFNKCLFRDDVMPINTDLWKGFYSTIL